MRTLRRTVAIIASMALLVVGFNTSAIASTEPEPNAAFNSNVTALNLSDGVLSVAIQSDGKLIAGGFFTSPAPVIRLNTDGTLDESFAANVAGINFQNFGGITALGIDSVGRILVGGSFTGPGGYLIRLNADGTEDVAFSTAMATLALGGDLASLKVLSDDSVLIGGNFPTNLMKISAAGVEDATFTAGLSNDPLNGTVTSIIVDGAQRVVIGGVFSTPSAGVARYSSTGVADAAFNSNVAAVGFDGIVFGLAFSGTNIVAVGGFTTPSQRLAQLTSTGSADAGFNSNVGPIDVDEDGLRAVLVRGTKILVGGDNSSPSAYLSQFDADGTPDTDFNSTINGQLDGPSLALAATSGGFVVGGFSSTPGKYISKYGSDTPTPQIPLNGCVTAPRFATSIPRTGFRKLMKPSCVTNASQTVAVRAVGRLARGDVRTFRLVCRQGNKLRAPKRSAIGSRYCASGSMFIQTYGAALRLRLVWHAPATDGFTQYRYLRNYRT